MVESSARRNTNINRKGEEVMIAYHTTTIWAARRIVADGALRPWNEVKNSADVETLDPGQVFCSSLPYYDNEGFINDYYEGSQRNGVLVVLRLELNADDVEVHNKGYNHPYNCGCVFYADNAVPVEVASIHPYTDNKRIQSLCIDSSGVYHDDEIFTYNTGALNLINGLVNDWRNKNDLKDTPRKELLEIVKYSETPTEKDCDELTEFSWETGIPIGPCAWSFIPDELAGEFDELAEEFDELKEEFDD